MNCLFKKAVYFIRIDIAVGNLLPLGLSLRAVPHARRGNPLTTENDNAKIISGYLKCSEP
ncbi:MAG: hypothetical protein IKI11_00460 [Neisseriaceae bacterium]|nr:hypothetical protein [Neisseriaceae bacterium]